MDTVSTLRNRQPTSSVTARQTTCGSLTVEAAEPPPDEPENGVPPDEPEDGEPPDEDEGSILGVLFILGAVVLVGALGGRGGNGNGAMNGGRNRR